MTLYDRGQAFFTLPDVVDAGNLDNTLTHSVFIEPHSLYPNTSLIYVPENAVVHNNLNQIRAKIRNGPMYRVPSHGVYSWDSLYNGLESCDFGLQMAENGEYTEAFDTFDRRVTTLARIKSDDDAGIDEVMDRIQTVVDAQEISVDYPVETYFQTLPSRLRELAERGTDLSTHGIGRSRHTMMSK